MFWCLLKVPCYEAIAAGLRIGKLHNSAKRGVINLIPKQGKDSRKLKNIRPITLLCIDYKMVEKALANQIKLVIDEIINRDQRGL